MSENRSATTTRPFRFGAQVPKAASAKEWAATARELEDLGYSTLFMPDHFDDQLAPVAALMAAADATTTLRVGSLVLDNDYKHPLVLAKEAATIDVLSDGRLELGLGAGWLKTDYEQSGIPYDRPGVRIDRFEEGLAIIKGLLSDDGPVNFAGKHYTVTAHEGTPKPVQKPHPPILIGGGGKRVLSIAGREADIVSVNFDLRSGAIGPGVGPNGTAEVTAEKIGWVRAAAGDRFDDIELSVTVFAGMVTEDPQSLAAAMGPGFGITPEQALEMPHALIGSIDQMAEALQHRREQFGFSYIVVSSGLTADAWRSLAPLVAKLAGT
jgi:probable F420-dependent oxidoreductase